MNKALAELSKNSKKETSSISDAWKVMTGILSADAVKAALGAIKDAFKQVFNEGVAGAIEYQDALRGMNNSLALTGQYSAKTSKDLDAFANSLEETSNFSDTAALSTLKLLSTLTQLDGAGLKKATQASADLAAALGIDLEQAASLVAKSINGNESALKKYGVTLSGIQEGVKNTDTVLAQLNSRFSGAAAGQISTFGGQINQVKNKFEDFAKAIGETIISNQSIQNALGAVGKVFGNLENIVTSNADVIRTFIDYSIMGFVALVKAAVQMADGIRIAFNAVGAFIGASVGVIIEDLKAVAQFVSGDWSGAMDTFSNAGTNGFAVVKEAVESTNPVLELLKSSLDDIGMAAAEGFGKVQSAADQAAPSINNTKSGLMQMNAEMALLAVQGGVLAESLIASSVSVQDQYAMELEQLQLNKEMKLISDIDYFAQKEAALATNIANETAALELWRAKNNVDEAKYQAALVALQAKSALEAQKIALDKQKFDEAQNKAKLQGVEQTFGGMASLMQTGSRSLFEIGKAAAIGQATVQGVLAVQNALSQVPYPFNLAAAAAMGVQTAVNVSKIAGQSFGAAKGIDEVPAGFNNDTFPARLSSGERVVPKETNKDLQAFLANGGQQSGGNTNITVNLHDIFTTDPRTLGMKVVEAINEAAQANGVRFVGVKMI